MSKAKCATLFGVAVILTGCVETDINNEPVTSSLWKQYETAKASGGEPELADFSYAGYRWGEEAIPAADWKTFDVTKFGAVPDDGKSDKEALKATIKAAEANGSGIVYFPPGKFRINEPTDPYNETIYIESSRIVFRGSGSGEGGTELYMDHYMDPIDPDKLWTCPYLVQFKGPGETRIATGVVEDSRRETYAVTVADASRFKAGDWVVLSLIDNSPEGVAEAVAPYEPDPAWTALIEDGVEIREFHAIADIDGNRITFKEPIHADVRKSKAWKVIKIEPLEEIGIENLAFVGNWKEPFVHHKNPIHDGGWSVVKMAYCVNSWVKDCRFTDVSRPLTVQQSSAVTIQDIEITGNLGHHAVMLQGSCHSLVQRVDDQAGMWHAGGVSKTASGNVFLRCEYTEDTCYESHASQPRWTLFDNVSGGWMYGRWGGARKNQPNHLEGLVFWNYENTGAGEPGEFHFMRPDSPYGRIIMPYVIGFHGNPQAWVEEEIKVLESNGKPVEPESLYEAQFKLRMENAK